MSKTGKLNLEEFMNGLIKRNPGETEFHQAVEEVASTVIPFINKNPIYIENQILERMTEPDRTIIFRVCWEDDSRKIRTNKGYRVQFNNSIGPTKADYAFTTLSISASSNFWDLNKHLKTA